MGTLLFLIAIASGGDDEQSTTRADTTRTTTTAPSAQPPAEVRLAFGESHAWVNEEITLSPPVPYEEDNQFLQPDEGNRYVAFDVTVRNISARDFNAATTEVTVALDGRVGRESFLLSDARPQTRIPPGETLTYTKVFEVPGEPGELRVSVRPDIWAGTTAYYTGPF